MRQYSYLLLPVLTVLAVVLGVYAACEPASAGALMVPVRTLAIGGMLYALGASVLVLWSALRGESVGLESHRVAHSLVGSVCSALLLSCVALAGLWCMTLADLSGVPLMNSSGISERWESAADSFRWTDPAQLLYSLMAWNAAALIMGAIARWRYRHADAKTSTQSVEGSRPRLVPGSVAYWLIAALITLNLGTYAGSGHALSAADRVGASSGLWVHLVGVALWAGGLLALVVLGRGEYSEPDEQSIGPAPRQDAGLIPLYSQLALAGALLCVLGGVGVSLSHAERLKDIDPGYAMLVLAKAVLSVVLIAFGAVYRLRLIPAMSAGPESENGGFSHTAESARSRPVRLFHRMIILELMLMAALAVLGSVLARTDPGALNTSAHTSYIRQITWYDLPPAITAEHLLTLWRPDYCALALAAGMLTLAVRLWRRDYIFRATAIGLAACIFIYAASGAPAIYGRVLYHAALARYTAIFCTGALIAWALMPLYKAWRANRARGLEITVAVLTAFFGLLPISTVAWSDSFLISKLLRDFMSYELFTFFALFCGVFFCALCILVHPGLRALICGFHGFGTVLSAAWISGDINSAFQLDQVVDIWSRRAQSSVKAYSTFSLSYDVNIGDSLYAGAYIIYGGGYVLLAICGLSILQLLYRGFKQLGVQAEYSGDPDEEQTRVENQQMEEELERIYGQSWDEGDAEPGSRRP